MKTTAEFIERLVTIDFREDDNCFGYYPFHLFVETVDGKFELNALDLAGDVLSCYRRARHYVRLNAKSLFLSIDFPAGGDIEHDFVAVISVVGNVISAVALPYETKTGQRFPDIHKSDTLSRIRAQFIIVAFELNDPNFLRHLN